MSLNNIEQQNKYIPDTICYMCHIEHWLDLQEKAWKKDSVKYCKFLFSWYWIDMD